MMLCPHCGQEHQDEMRFCPITGKSLVFEPPDPVQATQAAGACPHCGGTHPPNIKFCPIAGKPLKTTEVGSQPTSGNCPHCGAAVQLGWARCTSCGGALAGAHDKSSSRPFYKRWQVWAGALMFLVLVGVGVWLARSYIPIDFSNLSLPEFFSIALGEKQSTAGATGRETSPPDDGKAGDESMAEATEPAIERTPQATHPSPTPTAITTATATPSATPTPQPTSTPAPTATATPQPKAYSWSSEVIQAAQAVGYFTTIELDRQNSVHIGYFQENYDIVQYAHNDSGKWLFDYVVGGLETGLHLSMALDDQDRPHFAYHMLGKKQSPEVRYTFWNGAAWNTYRVFTSKAANTDISLALDSKNQPHISYLDGYSNNVRYTAYTASGGWDIQTVDAGNQACQSHPIVVDQQDRPHLAYMSVDGILKYALLDDGNWQRYDVDTTGGAGLYSALALDAAGNAHIAYYNEERSALYYARQNGAEWEITLLDQDGDVGRFPDIAVSPTGQIHISYYDASNSALKYAHGRGGNWDIYEVDNAGNVGQWNSIALDSQGTPMISYLDRDNEDLKMAFAIPTLP